MTFDEQWAYRDLQNIFDKMGVSYETKNDDVYNVIVLKDNDFDKKHMCMVFHKDGTFSHSCKYIETGKGALEKIKGDLKIKITKKF